MMHDKKKLRILSSMLAAVLVFTSLPASSSVTANAEQKKKEYLAGFDGEERVSAIGQEASELIEISRQEQEKGITQEQKKRLAKKKKAVEKSAENNEQRSLSAQENIQGTCGENVNFSLNTATGKLMISGSGAIADYEYATDSPFYPYGEIITSVEIDEGITSVGKLSFAFCFGIERVILPDTLTAIGDQAFLGCVSLQALAVPENVTSIGNHALAYDCTIGKEGNYRSKWFTIIGKSGSAAESYATEHDTKFVAKDQFTYSCGENASWSVDLKKGELKITGSGPMSDYYVTQYDGRDPEYYFYQSYINSVVIDAGITSIGREAFIDFSYLTDIQFSNNITSIGDSAFQKCGRLADIMLPGKLASVGKSAFADCYQLKSVAIPAGVSKIGTKVFSGCSRLEKIEVPTDNANFSSERGVLFDKGQETLIAFPKAFQSASYIVPETVTAVETDAFTRCSVMKNLVFKGDAPSGFTAGYQILDGLTIYYDATRQNWETITGAIKKETVTMIDMSGLLNMDSLSVKAENSRLEMGASTKLRAEISPYLATEFLWSSSDEGVAVVSDQGKVMAVNPGNTEIQVKSADGKYHGSVTITVTGTSFSMPDDVLETLTDGIHYTATDKVTKQFISEKLHGIYFLEDKTLGFYSLIDKSYKIVETFQGCKNAYVAKGKLYILYKSLCYIYDLDTQSLVSEFEIDGSQGTAVGADARGRIYIGTCDWANSYKDLVIMYTENGEKLSEVAVGTEVYAFSGFDNTNGYFYMETYYDYYSWGYSHPGKGLRMGKTEGNTLQFIDTYYSFLESGMISRSMSCLLFLCQSSYLEHQTSVELIGGKYLAATSVLHSSVTIFDSNAASDQDVPRILSINRPTAEEDASSDETWVEHSDLSSIGVRTVYNERNNSIFIYENNKTISEYSLDTGEKLSYAETKHKVFNLLEMGDSLIAIEKQGTSYYMEILDQSAPKQITIQAESRQLKVGESQQLEIESGKKFYLLCSWSSSDSSVVSVSKKGIVSAWKEGEAVITAKVSETLKAEITIKVTTSDVVAPAENFLKREGEKSKNVSANNYTLWASTVSSYLVENDNQTLTRVEYIKDKGVLAETYSKEYKLLESKFLPMELSYFGGFYCGKNANFIVFGQKNEKESDGTEVVRIVKYNKNWERQGQCSVKGANTYIPFDAGSLRMAENENMLYLYTCHEMYAGNDSVHHQANMTFVVNEDTMGVSQSYYDVLNIAQAGYVSHSFNQFIKADGKYIYRVDHGDANPRAVSLIRCKADGKITDVSYTLPFPINGNGGANATGVSVGGFELSSDNCLIAGNSVDMSDKSTYSANGKRNIFVTVTGKELDANNTIWLTDYPSDSDITVNTPSLVKLSQEQFLVMWEEYSSSSKKTKLKMVTIDSDGNKISKAVERGLRLSDCSPILTSDGLVKWYVTDGASIIFCMVNPYDLSSVTGDISDVLAEEPTPPSPTDDGNSGITSPPPSTGDGNNGITSPPPTGNVNKPTPSRKPDGAKKEEDSTGTLLKQGKTVTDKKTNLVYVVSKTGKTVSVKKAATKKITKAVIPSTVKLHGVKYKVTAISAKAFYKCKKLTKVSIPSQVSKIGAKAFYGCKKLKTITIKTAKLSKKAVGSKAFSGISAKASIKVPKKKKAAYRKMLRTKGVGKKAKIK